MLQLPTHTVGQFFNGAVATTPEDQPSRGMKVLHVEDDLHDAELIKDLIAGEWPDAEITCVSTRDALVRALEGATYDVILSDFALPAFDGMESLHIAKEHAPETPFIFVSGTIGEDRAIEAVRNGADDYVLKDRPKRLLMALPRALRAAADRRERRLAEARTAELADSLNQAREAVIVTDLGGRITFWNRGAEKLSGRLAGDAVGRTASELFDPETDAKLAALCKEGSAGEWSGEFDLRCHGGAIRRIELRVSLIRDQGGRPRSRLVLATDITERRAAERRVREQAEMLNQAREAIYITDLTGVVMYWNAGAERIFGWMAAEAVGLGIEALMNALALPAIAAAREQTIAQGQWSGELQIHHRAGNALIIESRQTLIRDDAGQPKALLCISSDVTERKRLEEQFLRAQRLENLGLLAAGIAHDLNNMLAPILLATPMLRDHTTDPAASRLLDTLEKSAERGAMLVRQILSFAHGVSGEQHVVQVKHLLRDVLAVVAGTFPKSIRLKDYVPSDLWPVAGNPTQIHQVLLNLCVNARDAMPSGGTLSVRAENRIVDAAGAAVIPGGRPGPFLVVEVEDTGTGIPPEILSRIWEPFFTTKESGRGTGLGLSTVRGIVQAHQGFTEVKSTVGVGTVFRIYLPAAPGSLPAGDTAKLTALPPGKGELILVVDDEQQIRETISAMLGRHGYRVLLARDGAEATAVFAQRATEIRLVISDLHMPNLDGAMLGRALRQITPGAKMLVVSGMASGLDDRVEYQPQEFADALLLKPFKAETLLETVHELLAEPGRRPFVVR